MSERHIQKFLQAPVNIVQKNRQCKFVAITKNDYKKGFRYFGQNFGDICPKKCYKKL